MKIISSDSPVKLLKYVPDFYHWNKSLQWMEEGKRLVQKFCPNQDVEKKILALEGGEIVQEKKFPFGFYPLENWRKFVLATYFADRISYSQSVDQVNFERLLFVMHAFPAGFRVWWMAINEIWWPVGYSAWYPMLETAFELFQKHPKKLKDRMVVPDLSLTSRPYLYLLNFSVAPEVKASGITKLLMSKFAEDIKAQNPAGLCCVAVSEDGRRVAGRLGMHHTGDLNLEGSFEGIYIRECLFDNSSKVLPN